MPTDLDYLLVPDRPGLTTLVPAGDPGGNGRPAALQMGMDETAQATSSGVHWVIQGGKLRLRLTPATTNSIYDINPATGLIVVETP